MKPPKTLTDTAGNAVPVKYVSRFDRDRDALVHRAEARFDKARALLEALVRDTLADLARFNARHSNEENRRGNQRVARFDGLAALEVRQTWSIRLDQRAEKARDMLLSYVRGLTERIGGMDGDALRAIVEETFRADSAGMLSVGRVVSLLRLRITAPAWIEATDILRESLNAERSKRYLRLVRRPDVQHDWRMVRLDLADCWPVSDGSSEDSKGGLR